MPRYVAVVARPDQLGAEFINQFHQQMRTLDADPYTDAQWGVVTGRSADDAMKWSRKHLLSSSSEQHRPRGLRRIFAKKPSV